MLQSTTSLSGRRSRPVDRVSRSSNSLVSYTTHRAQPCYLVCCCCRCAARQEVRVSDARQTITYTPHRSGSQVCHLEGYGWSGCGILRDSSRSQSGFKVRTRPWVSVRSVRSLNLHVGRERAPFEGYGYSGCGILSDRTIPPACMYM